eukprot:GEZU01010276.1.p2 GENE.GEZU01010276.1~~GEZU01010276.1.p2  ORF type:complete len:114 (+),score=34.33 GEZU01010276.1:570-911(+)
MALYHFYQEQISKNGLYTYSRADEIRVFGERYCHTPLNFIKGKKKHKDPRKYFTGMEGYKTLEKNGLVRIVIVAADLLNNNNTNSINTSNTNTTTNNNIIHTQTHTSINLLYH